MIIDVIFYWFFFSNIILLLNVIVRMARFREDKRNIGSKK